MERNNKLILIILVILTLSVVGVCVYSVLQNCDKKISDAIKFREEYTELNNKINESNGKEYVNVTISDKNTFKYVSEEEAVKLLEDGTGVIYFGFPECPWCRSLVSSLAKVAEEKNETIYYLNILDIRSSFEIDGGKLKKIKEGSKNYYKILDLLDEELEEFYMEDASGNKFDTSEKRLYAPTLVAINEGKITSLHVGTVESQESGYDELTEDQVTELENVIEKLINSKTETEVCTKEKC